MVIVSSVKHAIGCMRRQGKASVINTALFALMGAAAWQISYTASNGAVLPMSRELGVQVAREGIRVNAVCPGRRRLSSEDPAHRRNGRRRQRQGRHHRLARPADIRHPRSAHAFRRVSALCSNRYRPTPCGGTSWRRPLPA
jgi:NAD(P)-dependent dehydrogenase (short-subunit alcohol dehydrogenase family)